jgi:hypothetical protein
MKTAIVLLYILNVNGGAPVKVTEVPTMSECLDVMENATSGFGEAFRDKHVRLVCVPLDRKNQSD